ncbi:MAG: hypothetical protein QW568_04595 [Candidatus Anstonellaceae archaeon]
MAIALAERILSRLPKKGRREILLLVFILAGFLFIVMALIFSYHLTSEQQQFSPILGPFMNYHVEFMVAVATLGVAVGAGAFYLVSGIIEKSRAETKWNAGLLLKFLGDDERSVVGLLLKKKGIAYQSEIAGLEGMSRVKAHRVISKLERRGVVSVRKAGKINILEMPHELLDGLMPENGGKN